MYLLRRLLRLLRRLLRLLRRLLLVETKNSIHANMRRCDERPQRQKPVYVGTITDKLRSMGRQFGLMTLNVLHNGAILVARMTRGWLEAKYGPASFCCRATNRCGGHALLACRFGATNRTT